MHGTLVTNIANNLKAILGENEHKRQCAEVHRALATSRAGRRWLGVYVLQNVLHVWLLTAVGGVARIAFFSFRHSFFPSVADFEECLAIVRSTLVDLVPHSRPGIGRYWGLLAQR